MRLSLASILICFVVMFWVPAEAQKTLGTTTTTICKTVLRSKSVANIPTTTRSFARTRTITFTSTSTPIVKFTPAPVIENTTATVRTTTTDIKPSATTIITITISTTIFSTSTAPTSIAAETALETETIFFTTTVPVDAAFTPVLDTIPNSSDPRKKKVRRAPRAPPQLERRQIYSAQYPARVKCNVVTKTVILVIVKKTASTTKTITVKPSTTYQTATTTVTDTATIYPPDSQSTTTSTSTVTSIVTTTPIFTSTYTTTETILVAVSTYYPQCDAGFRNYASQVHFDVDQEIYAFAAATGESASYTPEYLYVDLTPQECCATCFEDVTCAASFSRINDTPQCTLISRSDDTCDPANPLLLAAITTIYGVGDQYFYTVSNNKCGKFVEARPDS